MARRGHASGQRKVIFIVQDRILIYLARTGSLITRSQRSFNALTDNLNQAPFSQTFRIRLKAPEFLIWLIFYQWAYFCDHLNASEQFFGNLFSGHGRLAYIFTGAKCVWRLPNEIVPIIDQWTAAVMDKNCTLIGSDLWAMFDKMQATALVSFRKSTVRRRDHY